ncbi:transmembrane protein, putative (macronuclear) [Tetrahymena thermophila SB210]|uniref:Transmembrane protein, putative n=1 Tax=Tetrahymena thermophila (strain SB210) TaxID=312017 RepID=W7XCS0_TETTS|nr:transmembrane protein, putative [Tetrahymena thermophila SB210]EWS71591.1 transmembrane protein, putative [Tetrahymena thermophila SB210]|eukprot:XP_012655872.1 transmembrane protein, putative [Tetrahymena thermophila SB210]
MHFLLFHIFLQFFYQIINYIFFLPYLKRYNQIGAIGTSSLGFALANCINLSNLIFDFNHNQIGSTGAQNVGSALANCTNLSNLTLYLKGNQIDAKGASNLGFSLQNCTNLQNLTLDLRINRFGYQCESGFGSALNNDTDNEIPYFDNNQLSKSQKLKVKSKCLKSKRLVNFKIDF